MRRAFLMVLVLLMMTASVSAEIALTDAELAELLALVQQQNEADSAFIVIPEGYQPPEEPEGSFQVEDEGGITGEGDGRAFQLLLIGVDTNNPAIKGRSDTMILARLVPGQNSLQLISFMRDLYVTIPGRGHNRLNAAYAFGGPELLITTLENNFGVRPDGYLAVNFSLMAELVDAIGGITLEVSSREHQSLNAILAYYNRQYKRPKNADMLGRPGLQRLNGHQALAFARIRKMDSDYQRIIRQQKVMQAIYERLQTLDFGTLTNIIATFSTKVKTDLTIAEALPLMTSLLNLSDTQIQTLRVPVQGSFSSKMIRGMYFIVPQLERNRKALEEFLGN